MSQNITQRHSGPDVSSGCVVALLLKRMKRGPMDPMDFVSLLTDKGLVGNADQGGRRQVTILEQEAWMRVMEEVEGALPSGTRRANIVIRGLRLAHSRRRILGIGECRIRILGETKPCERMEEAHPGLQAAMAKDWAGGVFGEVVQGGVIRLGDPVMWEST